MRVAVVSDWFLPRFGGIELQIRDLALELQSRGCVVVLHTSTPGPANVGGVHVARLPTIRAPYFGFAISPGLISAIRTEVARGAYDVVHTHVSIVSPLAYASIIAARQLGLPNLVSFHSPLGGKEYLLKLSQHLTQWANWPSLAITAVSERVASELRSALPGATISILPNGADTKFWQAPRAPAHDHFSIFTALRLQRRKRPLALLRAFHKAQSMATRRLTLQIAGAGPDYHKLTRYIARHHLTDVTLLGLQSREALRSLYAQSDLFVLPSRREAFGLAALEARCALLPVIAMRCAGCADFLVTQRASQILVADDTELAVRMAQLSGEPKLGEQLGTYDCALDRYDWKNVAAAHLALYRQIAAKTDAQSAHAEERRMPAFAD